MEMSDDRFRSGSICARYDNAAVIQLVGDKPEWKTTPEHIHVFANLLDEAAVAEFLRTAYTFSPGCQPNLMHGDLIAEDDQ